MQRVLGTMYLGARLAELRSAADELHAKPGQVVLSWLVNSEPQMRPTVGVGSVEQLDDAPGASRLSEEHMARLNVAC